MVSFAMQNATLKEYADIALCRECCWIVRCWTRQGITGRYDFKITFMPDDFVVLARTWPSAACGSDNPAPNFFTAIQEQVGLKLDCGEGSDGCDGDRSCGEAASEN